jgi:hypothetical protein
MALFFVLAAGKMYIFWLSYYETWHPEIAQATPAEYIEELPLEGILIWDERVLTAPSDGVLTYPSTQPRRVAKGEAVAAVDGAAVKADASGYFLPALDGREGEWTYLKLWPGVSQFPVSERARPIENGKRLRAGEPVGKLVSQLGGLNCIAYLDKTASLERDIKRNFIYIKTEPNGKKRRARIRASFNVGQKIKLYIALPLFPPSVLMSREFSCSVVTEERHGVSVPDTAVTPRNGKLGVFSVRGNRMEFVEVEGFPIDEYNFFVTKGISSGSAVARYADKIREGVVTLW